MASDVQETPFVKQLAANGTSESRLYIDGMSWYTLLEVLNDSFYYLNNLRPIRSRTDRHTFKP